MRMKMETAEREDKLLGDMLEIIRFTEGVSAKLHRVMDEAKIYQVVRDEFAKTDHYTASILLLADDGASLRLAETSIAPSRLEVLEKASGLKAKEYEIKLSKSSIYSQVVKEGKTVHANVSDTIREFLPRPLAYLISKTMGYEKQSSILTPLYQQRKVIGVLAVSCADLCEYFFHSVENLALHISTALELAHEHAQRNRALQALKRYHAHLGELVEERTGELKKVNEKLREEITERKQAEEALKVEKNKLQSVIDAMADGLTIHDKDYNIVYQNEPLKRIFGDCLGEKCYRVYEGKEKVCEGCPIEKAFKDGKSHTSERRRVAPSGEVTFWEVTANPVRDAGGRIVSCLEIARDITERKRAEEALADEVTRRRILVDQSRDGIVVLDENAKVYEANQRFAEMLGYTAEEVRELHTWDWDTQWTREQLLEMGRKVDAAGFHLETYHRRKDGTVIDVDISVNGAVCGGQKLVFCVCRDVTARKQAEEALQAEQNKLQSVIDAMEYGLAIQDKDYNIIYQGTLQRTIFGDHLGEKCYRVYEGKEKVCEGCPVEKAFRDGKSHTSERRLAMPSGEVTFWENTANPIRDAGGKIVSCLEITRNITERKRAEEALRESREKLQKMFESVTDGISVVDLHGVIIEANQRAVEMHGFTSKDELLGRNALEVVTPRDQERIAANMRKAIKEGTIRGVEYTLLKADGTEFPGELSTSVLRDASGKPVAHITIARDVTERKQAEKALEESQEFSSSLLESSPNPITVVNLDTSLRYVNPALEKLTGFTLAEIVGRKAPYPWWPEEQREEITAAFKKHMARGGRRSERIFQKKNGERFWVVLNSAPVTRKGKPIYFILNWDDITERKQAEEKEKQLQQELYLAQRLASVGELAAGVAHEINNPLTGVLGFSQRLMRKSTDEQVSRDLEIIHSEARRAAEVVQNLLTFARRRQPKKEQSNINDIVQKTLELRSYALQTSNIEVTTALAHSLPKVMVDFPQIQEVFLNIILNAEQAMSEEHGRGKLIIKTRRMKDYVRISFADDGPGISPENLDKVFDPFFTTREQKGGTGLGLSACHGIVTEHGGRIYARSKPGEGATFFVELPLPPLRIRDALILRGGKWLQR